MHRHSGVAFQLRTLRRSVKPSRWGFNRSAARNPRKPSLKLDEENFTWATRGPETGKSCREPIVMSHVLVIDQNKRPLDPIHPGHARKLLSTGKAAVYRRFPFVLILKRQMPKAHPQPLRLKIDPGSHTTGKRRDCPSKPVRGAGPNGIECSAAFRRPIGWMLFVLAHRPRHAWTGSM